MPWTLDQLIRQTARFTRQGDILFTDGDYNGTYLQDDVDATNLKQDIINALNYIIRKTCREKSLLQYNEGVGITDSIDTTSLSYQFYKVKKITDSDCKVMRWNMGNDRAIDVKNNWLNLPLTIYYYYLPKDLAKDTDKLTVPEEFADPIMYCHYAAFEVLNRADDSKSRNRAADEMDIFNDMYSQVTGEEKGTIELEEVW